MEPILSIGITSYKRISELLRCVMSISTQYVEEIEILISEDHSPLSDEIKEMIEKLSQVSEYLIRFSTNSQNLGYDMNLGAIIQKCRGKYIFFMSDDDTIYDGCLDEIIPKLKENNSYGVLYAPFVYGDTKKKDRNHEKDIIIPSGEKSASRYIYDSILFSGLIFRRDFVKNLDASRFKNLNYFQVYMFLRMLYLYGGYYFKNPSVLCIGDGENAYGVSESSRGNEMLANRKSVKSNLEFNKTLIKTIDIFDEEFGTHIKKSFAKQYSLHSYSGLSIARKEGVRYFKEYWGVLNSMEIKLYPITKCYFWLLRLLGKEKSDRLLSGFRSLVKKE